MRQEFSFYLNDDNITDRFIINNLATEKNKSGLVKAVLYDYYKNLEPYARYKERQLTKER